MLAVTALLLSGCTPLVPVGRQVMGTSTVVPHPPDPRLIKVGRTQRGEVQEKFKEIDTGVTLPRLFWGRWSKSYFAWYGVTDSGFEQFRQWQHGNLLVAFDENSLVRSSEIVSDARIITTLRKIMQDTALASPPSPNPLLLHLKFHREGQTFCGDGTILAVRASLELNGGPGCIHAQGIDPRSVSIGTARARTPEGNQLDFTDLEVPLHFGGQPYPSDSTIVVAKPAEVIELLHLLRR
jgi:hypothetical protein